MIFRKKFPCIQMSRLLLITTVLLTALSGCAEKAESTEPREESSLLTVGYVKIGSESDWRIACNKSLDEAFSMENGYYLLVNDAQQKPEKQVKAMREFISLGVDYILLDPLMESGWNASLEEAKEAGIPVIVFDREVDVQDPKAYETWIGSDFHLEGERALSWLSAFLEEKNYHDNLKIVHLQGTLGSSAQIGRTAALMEALKTHENWTLLAQKPAEFTTAKGKEVMADLLSRFGDEIQVVYCENDNEAYGAIEAIRESGRIPGTDFEKGEILILSFDAAHNALRHTLNGEIAVDTECMPLYGPKLSDLIRQMEKGEKPEFKNYVTEEQFSSIPAPSEVTVDGKSYPVVQLTEDLIENRAY